MGSWRPVAAAAVLGLAAEAPASITYRFANYPDDQAGSMLSGFITLDHLDVGLAMDNVRSWSITITPPAGAATTTNSTDQGAELLLLGTIDLSATRMTIRNGHGSMLFMGEAMQLSYDRINAEYAASGQTFEGWGTHMPAMGGTDPWVIAEVATGEAPVPEPPGLALLGSALLCLAGYRSRPRPVNRARPLARTGRRPV